MSGPIVPPLTVSDEADGGSVSGRPITTIEVTSGTLTVSGRTATLDTSGSGGSPATPANSIQFNSDPAGTFSGSERLLFETGSNNAQIFMKSGNAITQPEVRAVDGWGLQLSGTSVAGAQISQVVLFGENDATEGIILLANNVGGTGAAVTIYNGELTTSGAGTSGGDLTITTGDDATKAKITLNAGSNGDVDIQTDGTGITEIQNATTNGDSVLSIMGNGTGDAKLDLQNASKRVWVLCDENKKLKIQGGAAGNTFVFDVTSATGGITFPDSTTLISAEGTAILATGVTDGYVLTADGAGASAWEAAGGGGAATLGELTDVALDETNFVDSLLIQTDSDGAAPTTGTLDAATDNIGIGAGVFTALTSATRTVAIGADAGLNLLSGDYNTLVGSGAGKGVTTGFSNVIIGSDGDSGTAVMTGSLNVHIGVRTGEDVTDGTYNVLVGAQAGQNLTTGDNNVLLGYKSAYRDTDSLSNTVVGFQAMYRPMSGSNIFIGHKAGQQSGTSGTGDSNIVIGESSVHVAPGAGVGNVAIGQGEHTVAEGDDQLLISSGAGAVNWIRGDNAGACYQGDNASTWSTTSDQRLKREIVDATVGLDAINAVQVRNFRYIEKAEPIIETDTDEDGEEYEHIVGYDGENRYDLDPEPVRVGVIAQELQEVLPDAVKENAHGHLIVNPDSINWALLKAVQELSAKVEVLEASQ